MSPVFAFGPRRRNPFGPPDPNDPQDAGTPDPGGGGAPQDQPAPGLFMPPPTSATSAPLSDPLQSADTALQGDRGSAFAPPGRNPRVNAVGDELPPRPEPPPHVPPPEYNPWSLGHANAYAQKAWENETAHNQAVFSTQMRAYEAEVARITQSQFYRNVYGPQNPGRDEAMREAAQIRADAPSKGNRTAQGVFLDPDSTPEQKAQAMKWQQSQPSMFQSDRAPVQDQLVQDIDPETGKVIGSHWENPVSHKRTDMPGVSMKNPPRPTQPGSERVDIRRQQFIKEYLKDHATDSDPEAGLAKELEVYDRQSNPALGKGRLIAGGPGMPGHGPLPRKAGGVAPKAGGNLAPEGTVVDTPQGRMVKQGGQWVPQS